MKRRTYLKGMSLATRTLAFIAGAISLPQFLIAATASKRPNIVIIMVDDMGFSDIGCYGAETETPHLDALAKNGLRFTQFYNTGRCCPTRAALLTGLYQHQAGIGHMTGNKGVPAYQGYLNDRCVTIAEVLKPAGYYTAISGKWHVGSKPGHWPRKRGFDRFYGIPEGGGHHYRSLPGRHLVIDDKPIDIPDGWYTTTVFTDWAVKFIDEGVKSDKPVFLYLAFTAPHWPLQAPENVTANFLGRYRNGWQPHREARFKRQMEMGLFPKSTVLAPIDPQTPDWKSVKDQEEMDLRMAIHAAMVHLIDEGVGRVVAKLNELGELDNTLILFLTDNGASAEGGPTGFVGARGGDPNAKTGTPDSYVSFGVAGANMCDAPFRKYKKYVHEGGIASPLVVHWPKGIPATRNGTLTDEVGHVIDLLPTCLDMADATYPQEHNNRDVIPVEGRSLIPALTGVRIERPEGLYFEHQGNAAVRDGDWKLVKAQGKSWSLYNLAEDRTELNDLSRKHAKKAKGLKIKWKAWAERVGVER
ncbi:MAG: arylsulfatase [Pirellulales bacterium]